MFPFSFLVEFLRLAVQETWKKSLLFNVCLYVSVNFPLRDRKSFSTLHHKVLKLWLRPGLGQSQVWVKFELTRMSRTLTRRLGKKKKTKFSLPLSFSLYLGLKKEVWRSEYWRKWREIWKMGFYKRRRRCVMKQKTHENPKSEIPSKPNTH